MFDTEGKSINGLAFDFNTVNSVIHEFRVRYFHGADDEDSGLELPGEFAANVSGGRGACYVPSILRAGGPINFLNYFPRTDCRPVVINTAM